MEFIAGHERVFVVEQNRDGQLRMMIVNEGGIDPAKLAKIVHYDGTPVTARFISHEIVADLAAHQLVPLREAVS
jgi:2-oxoglutarate ferredoxin oxidoreductase subunit alpha